MVAGKATMIWSGLSAGNRTRLTEPIIAAAGGAIWSVRAPAGYGKSTLLNDLAEEIGEERSFLFSAPDYADGPEEFWEGLRTALETRTPGQYSGSISGPALPIRKTRSRALGQHEGPLPRDRMGIDYLLIDDFDQLGDAAICQKLVNLSQGEPNLKIVVASRSRTALDSMSLRIQADVRDVSQKILMMSDNEILTQLSNHSGSTEASEVVVREIATATHRVPLLVNLAIREIEQNGPFAIRRLPRLATPFVEAILDEALSSSDTPGLLKRLIELSAADVLTADVAEAMLGADATDMLLEFERMGLAVAERVTFEDEAGNQWSQPCLMIAEPVLSLLRTKLRANPAGWRTYRRHFARWAYENSLPVMSLVASVDAGDYDLASEIVVGRIMGLVKTPGVITRVLGSVENSILLAHPTLAAALAIEYFASNDQQWKSRELFGISLAGISTKKRTAPPWDKLVYKAIELLASRLVSINPNESIRLASQVNQQIRELPIGELHRHPQALSAIMNQVCATLLYRGDVRTSLKALTMGGKATSPSVFMPNDRHQALSLRAAAHALAGELESARQAARSSTRIPGSNGQVRRCDGGSTLLARSYLCLEAGDFEGAEVVLRKLDQRVETIEYVHLIVQAHAWTFIGRDRAVEGATWLADLHTRIERQRPLSAYVESHMFATATLLSLCAGDFEAARQQFGRTTGLREIERTMLRTRIALAHEDEEKLKDFDPLIGFGAINARTDRERLDLVLLKAVIAVHHEITDQFERNAREAAAIVSRTGMLLPLLGLGLENASRISCRPDSPLELRLAFDAFSEQIGHGPKRSKKLLPSMTKREAGSYGNWQSRKS